MSNSAKKRILVVDDDAMNREVMEAFLVSENFEVLLAHNGKQGLDFAAQELPDLIILDVKMPDLSGYAVCETLKKQSNTQKIPVIIVTGFDAKEDRLRASAVGAEGFLPRPFDGDTLGAVVAKFIN